MIYAGAALVGWFDLGRWHRVWLFVSLVIAGGLGILYLVLDALIPPSFAGAGPRYLVFMVPLFYLLAAAGTMPRATRWLIVPLLLVNIDGLGAYQNGNWFMCSTPPRLPGTRHRVRSDHLPWSFQSKSMDSSSRICASPQYLRTANALMTSLDNLHSRQARIEGAYCG